MNKTSIAVVGMSCKFSETDSITEFWSNLRQGKELVSFFTTEELRRLNFREELFEDPQYIKAGSLLRDKDSFDHVFFGYTKEEAQCMDPQVRLFHEYAWRALEDAGVDPFTYPGKIGLFASASGNINWLAHSMLNGVDSHVDPFFRNILSNNHFLSTLLAYKLNCKGPAYFTHTACSTSLASIHIACRSLLMKECDVAVTGAVRINSSPSRGYRYHEGMIYSKDGYCRVFDAEASGTIEGDGLGVVVLRRLEDAVRDGDNIYAVVRSSAVNNDGNRKVGYTAPSIQAQAECIRMAHKLAGISPETVTYIEAHGTGTRLGDPVEVEALNMAFGNNGKKYCALGSVKSNLGHLDTAAGVAGFIKTVLALRHRELPPSLHYKTPNPEINFAGGPFYVNNTLQKWERTGDQPLRAGISAFGIGGTNVHILLEEAPVQAVPQHGPGNHLLVCSARSEQALTRRLADLRDFLHQQQESLADVAYTLQSRRKGFKYRHCVVCRDQEEAAAHYDQGTGITGEVTEQPLIVFLFPGQGSQYAGMGRGLYEEFPAFKRRLDEGFGLLESLTGENYKETVFLQPDDVGGGSIDHTRYAQPLLFIFEYALAGFLMDLGIRPDYMLGHSIGELTAACIAGVFPFEEGLELVLERARLMASCPAGAMLAVKAGAGNILPYLPSGISVSAINSPDSCVLSGSGEDIQALIQRLDGLGIAHTRVHTSHAFHSSMMDPILDDFAAKAAAMHLSEPRIPFISNVTGELAGSQVQSAAYWASHLRETVKFRDGISLLSGGRKTLFIEVGPGSTLTAFCVQSQPPGSKNIALNLLRRPADRTDDRCLFSERLGRLWVNGVNVGFDALMGPGRRRVVSLPPYRFDKYVFPTEVDPVSAIRSLTGAGNAGTIADIGEWFYLPAWKRSWLPDSQAADHADRNCLLLSDGSEFSIRLKALLMENGHSVKEVVKGNAFNIPQPGNFLINPSDAGDYARLEMALRSMDFMPDQVIYCWSLADTGTPDSGATTEQCCPDLFYLMDLIKGLHLHEHTTPVKIFFLTDRLQRLAGTEEQKGVSVAAVPGFLKVLAQENPAHFCCHVDIALPEDSAGLVRQLYREIKYNRRHPVVVYREGQRWLEALDHVYLDRTAAPLPMKQGGNYLITGGLGQAGACLAEYLLRTYSATVILAGRTALPPREIWDRRLSQNDLPMALADKIRRMQRLQTLPGRIVYHDIDLADPQQVRQWVAQVEDTYGRIAGIIHAAGTIDPRNFKPLESTDRVVIDAHFGPKVQGMIHLLDIFKGKDPDFVWVTSSLATVLGGLTYGAYSAANLFMDHLLATKKPADKRWLCVDLDGMAIATGGPGSPAIRGPELIEIFERTLRLPGISRVMVSTSPLAERIEKFVTKRKQAAGGIKAAGPTTARQQAMTDAGGSLLLTDTEKKLMDSWVDFFGIASLNVNSDFFELGGDSLKAMTLSKRVYKEFDVDIPVMTFFSNPTIRLLAREIETALGLKNLETTAKPNRNIKEIII